MEKHTTDCCALCQLSRVNNHTSIEDIRQAVTQMTKEMKANTEVGITTGNGQTAIFTIVSPNEWNLEANLKKIGFVNAHQFKRRVGYPDVGDLKMYIKNL